MGDKVSTRNLFSDEVEGTAADEAIAGLGVREDDEAGPSAAPSHGAASNGRAHTAGGGDRRSEARAVAAGAADGSAPRARTAEGTGKRTMQQIFREYNLDRKVSGQEQIMRVFKLPPDSKIVEKYQVGRAGRRCVWWPRWR